MHERGILFSIVSSIYLSMLYSFLSTALKGWRLQHASRKTQSICKSLRTKRTVFTFLKRASYYFTAWPFSIWLPGVPSHLLYFSEIGHGGLAVPNPHTRWQGQWGQILVVLGFVGDSPRLSAWDWTWIPLLLPITNSHLLLYLFSSCFSVSGLPDGHHSQFPQSPDISPWRKGSGKSEG